MKNRKKKRCFNNSKAKGNDKNKEGIEEFHLLLVYKEEIDYVREVIWSRKLGKEMEMKGG